ncbi:FAD-dependent oxidoreductase [Methylobacterium terricola]|uniref:Tryptophan 2-monooxygenase n=1 Tax=Methylobacterium terricola TaxID=2583531 RepID=A0A5C4LCS7_9HYPH|nr:FAD-dependent oxidoreductase [Methylobacterium terricola]TNC10442.1 FAD-dependent oxidoreductase [Methylobacterium terricola]
MTLSRRSLMAGAAVLAALPKARAAADADVVVVGAGAAGLAAAAAVRRSGHSVVVLEARERTGGRAFTETALGAGRSFDAGGQYVHWAERNPWREIARAAKVRTSDDATSPWPVLVKDGVRASEAERRQRRAGFGRVSLLLDHPAAPDRSVADAVSGEDEAARAAATGLTRLTLGEEPDRVSCADYDQLWSGDDIWVDGYGALVAGHYADLPVRLGTPATMIDWRGAGVAVETPRGTLRAACAIVTVPVGVLAAGALRFVPDLPAATVAAVAGLRMGSYTKIGLALDPARLGSQDLRDAVILRSGTPGLTAYLEMQPFGKPLAVFHCGGDGARSLCEAGEAAAVAAATDHLVSVFGAGIRSGITAGRLAAWWTDPFARGSYSIARPGHLSAREALRAPVAERIFLAGEALAGGGAMTVGGATLDGERAAGEVLKRLGS